MRTTTDRPHDGVNTIYTQHELTAGEIRRDKNRRDAINRNRAKGKHDINPVTIVHVNDPATDPQKGLIDSLLKDLSRLDNDTWMTAATWWLGGGGKDGAVVTATKSLASQTIERLKVRITEAKGRAPVTTPPTAQQETASARTGFITPRDKFADVPDGYYAVTTNDDVLAFYRVSTWEKSGDRKVQVRASDALHLIRGRVATDAILAKVRTATAPVAGKLYADHIGACYRCGRTLTDAESRARGIGPICVNL